MDEYEKLEVDLKKQYEFFIRRFMSLSFLEQQLDDYDKIEQEKMSEREVDNIFNSYWLYTCILLGANENRK